jgi:hypothetical protein
MKRRHRRQRWKRQLKVLSSNHNNHESAKKMGEFAKAQQKPDHAPNARERRVGVMMTPCLAQ